MPQAEIQQNKAKYANPDTTVRPVEALRHFYPLYRKGDGAKRMGCLLAPASNRSKSFRVFCDGVSKLMANEGQ